MDRVSGRLVSVYAGAGVRLAGLGSSRARAIGLLSAVPAVAGAWWAASSNAAVSFTAVLILILPPVLAAWYLARTRGADDALVGAGSASLAAGLFTFVHGH